MSEPPKFRNENKLTDEELLAILETDIYDHYFNDSILENGSSDIEETDIVTETNEIYDVLQVSDSENDLADSSGVVGQSITYTENPSYTSKDGSVWAKVPLTARTKRRKCNIQTGPTGKEGNKPEKGQGQRVVLDLVNHLSTGYGITTDNFLPVLSWPISS
ncbi:unnamed protein product [Acanthoscelides obtectus]|uniref:Uncharacterized protein n=1 Tax=Acanthoscelides obtectus TaxID=200917 RepID=A0A9P0KRL7_ACAOB|nr:unnamed protein product [Acanthoscelides obtectus]CAK1674751.1 hypothetical protein AOBTE_LOCUS29726 [Acanthoscelides obtectus]